MSGIYNPEGKTMRLPVPLGVHNIHIGNGKLIEHSKSGFGNDTQVKMRLALGVKGFHGIRKMKYDGIDIPWQNYRFFKDSGATNPADTMFPTRALGPGASFVDVSLLPGMVTDDQPDKLVVQTECLEIADYDASGNQIDFGFSDDAGRIAAFGCLFLGAENSDIEWESWHDYRQWTAELITVNIDGANQQLPRFPLNIFVTPRFSLETFLNRVCELTCSNWTYAHGKIRFIAARDRPPVKTISLGIIGRDFVFAPTPEEDRVNGVRVKFRDLDDPLLDEAEPEIVDRRPNQNILENFYEINAGNCRRDVAARLKHYYAKKRCDLTDFAMTRTSFECYDLLPADPVLINHTTPGWQNVRCVIIKKDENEDTGIGYPVSLQREPVNPYSDTDTAPIQTRILPAGPNPYAAPPMPALVLQQRTQTIKDGTVSTFVVGTLTFGNFSGGQSANIFHLAPSQVNWRFVENRRPGANQKSEFSVYNLEAGRHYFRAIPVSDLGVQAIGANDVFIDIAATDSFNQGRNVSEATRRSLNSFDSNGNYIGNDTAVVPRSRITAQVIKGVVHDNGLTVDCNVAGEVVGAKVEKEAMGETIYRSTVKVFNKFGELVKAFISDGFTGYGTLGKGTYPRENADAFEEAYFEIFVHNRVNPSLPKYLYNGSTVADAPPPLKSRNDCPLNVRATPLSANSISFSGTFNFSGGRTLTLQKREIGQTVNDWVNHIAGIGAYPFVGIDLPDNKELEYRFVSSHGIGNTSNIVRAKTLQVGQNAPTRPVPSGLSVVADGYDYAGAERQNLDANWTRNATDNDFVQIEINGVVQPNLPAGTVHYDINGIGEGQSRTVRVRNGWNSGVPFSLWSDAATGRTEVTPPAVVAPQNFAGSFDPGTDTVNFVFNPGTGSGGYTLFMSSDGGANYAPVKNDIPANATSFSYPLAQTTSAYSRKFILRRNDVDANSNVVDINIPAEENNGWEHPEVSYAFAYNTGPYTAQVEGNFIPRGGNGGFAVYFDEANGSSMMFGQSLSANQRDFSFQVNRTFNNSFIYVYVYRDDVYSQNQPIKYTVEIPGTYGGEIN